MTMVTALRNGVLHVAFLNLLFLTTASTRSHYFHDDHHSPSHSSRSSFLSRLLSQSPLVLVVNSKTLSGVVQSDESVELLRGGGDADIMSETPKDNEAYMLYNALRSTQEKSELDEKSHKKLEGAKEVLKMAFIARCGQRNTCQQKCEKKKKPSGCAHNCQKVFDELDACNEEKPKKKDKCKKKEDECGSGRAKTMPPHWLRSLLGM